MAGVVRKMRFPPDIGLEEGGIQQDLHCKRCMDEGLWFLLMHSSEGKKRPRCRARYGTDLSDDVPRSVHLYEDSPKAQHRESNLQ